MEQTAARKQGKVGTYPTVLDFLFVWYLQHLSKQDYNDYTTQHSPSETHPPLLVVTSHRQTY